MNTGIYLLHEGFTVLVIFPVLFMQNRMNQLEQTVTASLQLILELWCIQLNQWEVVIVVFFHRRCYYVGIARERLEWYSPRDKHRSRRPAKNDVILEKIISQSSIWQSSFFWSLFWTYFTVIILTLGSKSTIIFWKFRNTQFIYDCHFSAMMPCFSYSKHTRGWAPWGRHKCSAVILVHASGQSWKKEQCVLKMEKISSEIVLKCGVQYLLSELFFSGSLLSLVLLSKMYLLAFESRVFII